MRQEIICIIFSFLLSVFFFFHGLHTLLLVDVQPMDLLAGRLGRDWWVFILKVWGPVLVGTHLWHWNESNGDLSRPSGPPSTSRYTPLTKPDTTGDRTRDLLIGKRMRKPLDHVASFRYIMCYMLKSTVLNQFKQT